MSGYSESDAIARFAGKALAGFVQKAFKPDELLVRLHAAIEKTVPAA
jgi:DNA-binding response OmpR family regulator